MSGIAPAAALPPCPPCDLFATAPWTLASDDLDAPADPQLTVPMQSWLSLGRLDDLARAHIDPLPLVVEVSTAVDELVVWVKEVNLAPPLHHPKSIQLLD